MPNITTCSKCGLLYDEENSNKSDRICERCEKAGRSNKLRRTCDQCGSIYEETNEEEPTWTCEECMGKIIKFYYTCYSHAHGQSTEALINKENGSLANCFVWIGNRLIEWTALVKKTTIKSYSMSKKDHEEFFIYLEKTVPENIVLIRRRQKKNKP